MKRIISLAIVAALLFSGLALYAADPITRRAINKDNKDVLILEGYRTSNSTAFKDFSQNHFTLTPSGDVHISTAQTIFSGFPTVYFGTSGGYLTIADNDNFTFGTGDFTIRAHVRLDDVSVGRAIISQTDVDGNNTWYWTIHDTFSQFAATEGGVIKANYTWDFTPSTGIWYDLILRRSGSSLDMYVDRVSQARTIYTAIETLGNLAQPIYIGTYTTVPYNPMYGYIDQLCISKGIARPIELQKRRY